jgi:hypothetical protein
MFLIERAISISCFYFAMFMNCFLFSYVKGKQYKLILFFYLLLLCIFAFAFEPYETSDLYRIREYIQSWINYEWEDMLYYAFKRGDPVWVIFSYLTSLLGNINWLQTISCFCGIALLFSVISDLVQRFKLKGKQKGILLFTALCSGDLFMGLIGGIRSPLGSIIVFYCIYKEVFGNRSVLIDIPLYLIAAGLHSFTFVLVIIRFFFLAIQGKNAISHILAAGGSVAVIAFILVKGQFYIEAAMDKAGGYTNNAEEYTYFWAGVVSFLTILLAMILLVWLFKKIAYKNEFSKFKSYAILTTMCTMIGLIAVPFSFAVYVRMTMFAFYLAIPLFAIALHSDLKSSKSMVSYYSVKYLIISIWLISMLRGGICSYKFFVL